MFKKGAICCFQFMTLFCVSVSSSFSSSLENRLIGLLLRNVHSDDNKDDDDDGDDDGDDDLARSSTARSSTRPEDEGQAQNEAEGLGNGNTETKPETTCPGSRRVGIEMKTFEFLFCFGGDDVHPHDGLPGQVGAATVFAGIVEAHLELETIAMFMSNRNR